MKYTDILAWVVFIFIFSSLNLYGFQNLKKLNDRAEKLRMRNESLEFVSESFRNACNGKGFSSLNEWQKTCKAMWNLDYIGWGNAEDFMNVNTEENETLLYGKWTGHDCNGEVFCRK